MVFIDESWVSCCFCIGGFYGLLYIELVRWGYQQPELLECFSSLLLLVLCTHLVLLPLLSALHLEPIFKLQHDCVMLQNKVRITSPPGKKKKKILYSKLRRTNTHTQHTHTHRTGCGHDFALSCNTSLVLFQIFRVPPSCLICKCIWKHSKWATTGYVQQRPNIRLYLQISALHTLQHG